MEQPTAPQPLLDAEQQGLAICFNNHQDYAAEIVADVQALLEVSVTRSWNEETVVALAAWQRLRKLPVTGTLNAETEQVVSVALVELAPPSLSGSRDVDRPLNEILADAVKEAEKDWLAGASEVDVTPKGRLAAIFRDAGWSRVGVERQDNGHIYDWCGMASCSWLVRVGMAHDLRRGTFYSTRNVSDFFTYNGSPVNSNRTRTRANIDGRDVRLSDLHKEQGSLRSWTSYAAVRSTKLTELDIQPGDIVLINHNGQTDGAHHITMVRSWNAPILETIEGNASGTTAQGGRTHDSVVINRRDLSTSHDRNKIYGIGRVSICDFLELDYRP